MTLVDLEQKLSQNPRSPLFARLAKEYLSDGRVEEAKQLCVSGIQLYPAYATAHLVLAQCYHADQNSTKALHCMQEAMAFLPDSLYLRTLYDDWRGQTPDQPIQEPPEPVPEEAELRHEVGARTAEMIEEPVVDTAPKPSPEIAEVETALPPDVEEMPTLEVTTAEITEQPATANQEEHTLDIPPVEVLPPSVIDKLQVEERNVEEHSEIPPSVLEETLTNEMVTAELLQTPPPVAAPVLTPPLPETAKEPPPQPYDEEGRIVSKTLAEIYASQGAYSEAILTYQLLKTLRPAQSAEYDQRIKELEPKLQEKTTQ